MWAAILVLVILFILWKLFVEGLLFRIILFIFGWIGIYVVLAAYVPDSKGIAIRFGSDLHSGGMSWAALIPTIICLLCLAFSKGEK